MRRWLAARFFFPLFLCSLLAMSLYAGWHALYGAWRGPRLHLNLFLAWTPYLFALWASAVQTRHPQSSKRLWLPAVLWLLFFPNAPYLITDWLYLPGMTAELWYSIALFTTFSMCGILLSAVSLHLMHRLIRVRRGAIEGWAAVSAAVLLSGLGVYMGRFLRLNSWEVFTQPMEVFRDVTERLHEHVQDPKPFNFTIMFAVLILVFYLVFVSIRWAPSDVDDRRIW